MTSSLDMIQHCEARGILGKEAAAQIRHRRERMVKEAIGRAAIRMFSSLGGRAAAEPRAATVLERLMNPRLAGKQSGPNQWSDVAMNLAKLMGVAGATAGATHGIYAAGQAVAGRKLEKRISRSYKEMLDEYPRLKEEDPDRVRRPFGLLARVAPNLAAEPMVAGAFVYNNIQQGGIINHGDIKALAEAQSALQSARESKKPPYFAAGQTAAQFAGKAMGVGGGGKPAGEG